jgi:hypothetical protein
VGAGPSGAVGGGLGGEEDGSAVYSGGGDWWRLPDESAASAPAPDGRRVPTMRGPAQADFGVWDRVELDFDVEEGEEGEETEEDGEAEAAEGAAAPGPVGTGAQAGAEEAAEEVVEVAPRRRLLRFRRGPRRATGPLLWLEALAALLLAAAAVLGLWYLAVLGWFATYGSVRLGQTMRKFVSIGVPALTVAGGLVWLWARSTGHWGAALTHPQAMAELKGMWGALLRIASAASAVLLGWLIYRQRRW